MPNPRELHSGYLDNYAAVCRHYQFADLSNGSWYIEILPAGNVTEFIVQEVRNGTVVRRSRPQTFAECRKTFWARSHRMSIEAGIESLPPPMPRIDWNRG